MKHLTYEERLQIQGYLTHGLCFAQIAKRIGKDRSTISREIKNRREFQPARQGNFCARRSTCRFPQDCHVENRVSPKGCRTTCGLCQKTCVRFEEEVCARPSRPPYVCNGCRKRGCKLGKWTYSAKEAQRQYERSLVESREGISLSEGDLRFLEQEVIPLVRNGISLSVAHESLKDSMPVSARTLYTYIDHGLFEICNLDLRRKARRPWRKKSGPVLKVDKQCHVGRGYEEFQAYWKQNPDAPICQMDTVEGKKGGKVLLTLFFANCNLQLMYLRQRNTSASVTEVFQQLRGILDVDFARLFPVILTDRGTEFTNPRAIEYDIKTGLCDCAVFFCDPMNTNQKSECERNHELIRYVIPKGTSMDGYEQADIDKLMSHVNSYPRDKWNGLSPMDLFERLYGSSIAKKLGLARIPIRDLRLTPELLKK